MSSDSHGGDGGWTPPGDAIENRRLSTAHDSVGNFSETHGFRTDGALPMLRLPEMGRTNDRFAALLVIPLLSYPHAMHAAGFGNDGNSEPVAHRPVDLQMIHFELLFGDDSAD